MKTLLATLLALLAFGCNGAPPLGDVSYQTATYCTAPELYDDARFAADYWRAHDARINMHVVLDSTDCDVLVYTAQIRDYEEAVTRAGEVRVDDNTARENIPLALVHEFGHLILGHLAYEDVQPGEPEHNPDVASVMFRSSGSLEIQTLTEDDLRRIPSR